MCIRDRLEAFGAQVTNQYADLIAYDGTLLKARNIIGSYKPESKKRIALFAHWDTRPWADNCLLYTSRNYRKSTFLLCYSTIYVK